MEPIKRNVLLNPGPSTTTDSVKYAQVMPDICPREKEFSDLMKELREELVKVVHGDLAKYTSVLFCGSGTINIDVVINSLLPEGKKVLVINNGAYSTRAVEICQYYGLPHIDLRFPVDQRPDLEKVEETMRENSNIALVHTTHNETGTGILNPIREIGAVVHKYGAVFTVDTTSTYAMRPVNMEEDNIDFCMASAQKGLMAFTGLSFIVGSKEIIEKSKDYPKRSYYCNLFMQYDFFERTGQMHFTPPVQTIYAAFQALKEYWAEGEKAKWARHTRVFNAINDGLDELGFRQVIKRISTSSDKQPTITFPLLYASLIILRWPSWIMSVQKQVYMVFIVTLLQSLYNTGIRTPVAARAFLNTTKKSLISSSLIAPKAHRRNVFAALIFPG